MKLYLPGELYIYFNNITEEYILEHEKPHNNYSKTPHLSKCGERETQELPSPSWCQSPALSAGWGQCHLVSPG